MYSVRLLIECGNSSIKLALNNKLNIGVIYDIDCRDNKKIKTNIYKSINKLIKNKNIEGIYIAYVNKQIKNIIIKIIKKEFSSIKVKILNKRKFKNFKLKYDKPSTFGMDRFLNCIGTQSVSTKSSFIVIDIGTATTIDVVDSNLSFMGGVILPGPLTSYQSLLFSTSMIGNHEISVSKKLLGNTTKECLNSGFTNGQFLMIQSFVSSIKKKYKRPFKIIITGGLSGIFQRFFPKSYIVDHKLTFKGMLNLIESMK
mgnify:CR=1 FL=1|tara:strand:+ start:2539 stop:3306 length:768 start_codon:yes stop_codon:yes gene_type:complete